MALWPCGAAGTKLRGRCADGGDNHSGGACCPLWGGVIELLLAVPAQNVGAVMRTWLILVLLCCSCWEVGSGYVMHVMREPMVVPEGAKC